MFKFSVKADKALLMSDLEENSNQFQKSIVLGPLKIEKSEFIPVVEKIKSLLETSNLNLSSNGENRLEVSTVFEDNEKGIERLDRWPTTQDLNSTFSQVYSFSLDYRFGKYDSKPKVKTLKLSFSNYENKIEVSGYDKNQIESVIGTAEKEFRNFNSLGGTKLHSVIPGVCFMLMFLWSILGKSLKNFPIPNWIYWSVLVLIMSGFYLALFSGLTSKYLPGFLLFSSDTSFLVKYGPQISFFSLLLGVVSIILTFYFAKR